MSTHLRVLSQSYPMNTNMIGFRWFFRKLCILVLWTKLASALEGLTHSCLEISLTRVISNLDSFENNFGIDHTYTKYLNGKLMVKI